MNDFWASHFEPTDKVQLFYMPTDISEKNDLSAKRPDIVERLMKLAERARSDLGEGKRIGKGERFFEDAPILAVDI